MWRDAVLHGFWLGMWWWRSKACNCGSALSKTVCQVPFMASNMMEMMEIIRTKAVVYPEEVSDNALKDLLDRLLAKKAAERIKMSELKVQKPLCCLYCIELPVR